MKKIILLLFIITIYSNTFSQRDTTKYYDYNWKPCSKKEAYYYREISYDSKGKPVGIVRDYYINGNIQWKGRIPFEDPSNPEAVDGECIWYFNDGDIEKIASYKNGKENGKCLQFWDSKALKIECFYNNGKLNGSCKIYNDDGILVNERIYKNDSIDGISKDYSDDGILQLECTYKNGLKEGIAKVYDYNGQLWTIENYRKGKKEGTTFFYWNDTITGYENYKNNILDGLKISNCNDGKCDTILYSNGIIIYEKTNRWYNNIQFEQKSFKTDSTLKIITENNVGNTISEENYKNGIKNGDFIYNKNDYDNKIYKVIEHYSNGQLMGTQKIYYLNGILKSEINYVNNRRNGLAVSYNELGIEISHLLYENDRLKEGYITNYSVTGIISSKEIFDNYKSIKKEYYYSNNILYKENFYTTSDTSISIFYDIEGYKIFTNQSNNNLNKRTYYDKSNKIISTIIDTNNELYDYRSFSEKNKDLSTSKKIEELKGNFYNTGKELNNPIDLPIRLFRVMKDSLYGLYSFNGKEILPCKNKYISDIQNGFIIYSENGNYLVIDIFGNKLQLKEPYIKSCLSTNLFVYSNTSFIANSKKQKYGIINSQNKIIIPCKYEWISEDIDFDVIWVKENGKFGAYNSNGKILLPTIYSYIPSSSVKIEMLFNNDSEYQNPNTLYKNYYAFNKKYFSQPLFSKDSVAILMKNEKYGLINSKGNIIAQFEYDSIISFNYWRNNFTCSSIIALVKKDSLWGAIDKKGNFIIPYKYCEIMPIITYNGDENKISKYTLKFLAKLEIYWGIITDKDSIIQPFNCEYGYLDYQKNENPNIYLIKDSIPYKIDALSLNTIKSNMLMDFIFLNNVTIDSYKYFPLSDSEYNPEFESNYKGDIQFSITLNSNGKIIVPPSFYLDPNQNSLQLGNDVITKFINKKGESIYINKFGKVILSLHSGFQINSFYGKYASVYNSNNKWGILDWQKNSLIIDTLYEAIYKFNETDSTFWVRNIKCKFKDDSLVINQFEGGWGLVDINNNIVLPFIYNFPFEFQQGISKITSKGSFGVVNQKGKIILPCEFKKIEILSNGYILFGNDNWGLADNTGKILFQPQWINVTPYIDDYLMFWTLNGIGIINKKGEIVLTLLKSEIPNYSINISDLFTSKNAFINITNLENTPIKNLILIDDLKNTSFEQNNSSNIYFDFKLNDYNINQTDINNFYHGYNHQDLQRYKKQSEVLVTYSNKNSISYIYTELQNRDELESDYVITNVTNQLCYNYLIKNNTIQKIELQDIFKTNCNYIDTLNFYLLDNIIRYNLKNYLNIDRNYIDIVLLDLMYFLKDSYTIDNDGLTFYLSAANFPNFYISSKSKKKYVEIKISFEDLHNIIDKHGIIKYVK